MIIYNVTVNIEEDVHQEWLKWMKEVHIPDVLNTGLFNDYKMCKVLTSPEEGQTYSIQYSCESMDHYNQYQDNFAPRLQEEHARKFKDQFVAFRTLLETV